MLQSEKARISAIIAELCLMVPDSCDEYDSADLDIAQAVYFLKEAVK